MEKIVIGKTHKYSASVNGIGIRIPDVFVKDNNLHPKSSIEIFRTKTNGKDSLILIPSNGNSISKITDETK